MLFMVLCVSSITIDGVRTPSLTHQNSGADRNVSCSSNKSEVVLQLTDGWYAVRAFVDDPLAELVRRGKIFVGQFLKIQDAQLGGVGTGCAPVRSFEGVSRCCLCCTLVTRFDDTGTYL